MQIDRIALSSILLLALIGCTASARADNPILGSGASPSGYLTGAPNLVLGTQTLTNSLNTTGTSGNVTVGGRPTGTAGGSSPSTGNSGFILPYWLTSGYLTPMLNSGSGNTAPASSATGSGTATGGSRAGANGTSLHEIDMRDEQIAKPWSRDERKEEESFKKQWSYTTPSWSEQTLLPAGKTDNGSVTARDINNTPQWFEYPPGASPLVMMPRPWLTESTEGEGVGGEQHYTNAPAVPGKDYGMDKGADSFPPFLQPIATGPITAKMILEVTPLVDVPSSNCQELRNQIMANYLGTSVKLAPRSVVDMSMAEQQAKAQLASDATGAASQQAFSNLTSVWMSTLPNVANENSATPLNAQPIRQESQAIWMVQQMYKQVFLPMAILLLLPGAILTQAKSLISHGFLQDKDDDDIVSPFTGILRSIIAIFLIPATQLIVSYAIDAGNCMAATVQGQLLPGIPRLKDWADEQLFSVPQSNAMNELIPPTNTGEQPDPALESVENSPVAPNPRDLGKTSDAPSEQSELEQQTNTTVSLEFLYNMLNMFLNFGLLVLTACQLGIMCYLLLLGPIAAAFFAWPSGLGGLFHKAFANWVDAVINLCLWRFWWALVVLCMQTRMSWLSEAGGFQINTQWEMIMFTAFMVIMMYVPFMPWSFKPGEMVSEVMNKVSQMKEASGNDMAGSGAEVESGSSSSSQGSTASASPQQSSYSVAQSSPQADDSSSAPVGEDDASSGSPSSWRFAEAFDESSGSMESGTWATCSTAATIMPSHSGAIAPPLSPASVT